MGALIGLIAFTSGALAADVMGPGTVSPAAAYVALGLALVLCLAPLLPWHRWPDGWQAAFPLAFFGVIVLLDYSAGFYYLAALPLIWMALFHSRRLLLIAIGLFAGVSIIPRLLLPEQYPLSTIAEIILVTALVGLIGLAAQGQVQHTRAVAAESAHNARQARADRDLLNAYLEQAGCLVVVMDPDSRVLLFNSFAEQVLGYRADGVVGRMAYYQMYEDVRARESFERVLAGDWPHVREDDSLTSSGEKRRIVWNITALTDEATGAVTHVISTGVDITGQRAAERLSANVLGAATEEMIMATDAEGVFTVFNVGAERQLGYSASEVVGRQSIELISEPEELAGTAAELGATGVPDLLANPPAGGTIPRREWTLLRRDGSRFPATMTINTMRDGDDSVGYVIVARDITMERAADAAMREALDRERDAGEQLRELDKVKNDFVATVSHDLRTPLTSIIGNTELLLDGDAGLLATPQRRLLDAVDRNARRLDTLVGDLLLLSRIESGTMRMQSRPVAVGEVVEGALEALAAKLTTDVRVEVEAPPEPVLVQGDPAQLERVATNLVGNALKFTPPGGRVTVAVSADPERVRIMVSDTGIGIPEEELTHVFDRFYRSSRSQQKDRPGTGLGLTIAKSIVEHHHGSIEVSGNPAGGTTFTITLPRLGETRELSEQI